MDTLKQQLNNVTVRMQPGRDMKPVRPTYEGKLSCCHFQRVA